ncbi:MAG TPA: radical SAM protein, partial [Chitinophagaceae bacterium]|nr:radical SAM protein [Chitinophagaceae bacterium]
MEDEQQYLKGRGAQFNPRNRFLKNERIREHIEGIDDWTEPNAATV